MDLTPREHLERECARRGKTWGEVTLKVLRDSKHWTRHLGGGPATLTHIHTTSSGTSRSSKWWVFTSYGFYR